MPKLLNPALATLFAATLALAACDDRRSADANVEQQTDRTATIPAPESNPVEPQADPTPQTGTGGAIPEADEGTSQ